MTEEIMGEAPEYGREAGVMDMADSREARAARQAELLREHGGCLVSLTMNVAGPVKLNPDVARAFHEGVRMLRDALAAHRLEVIYEEARLPFTGPEAFLCVRADAAAVKRLACAMEERDALGRLLDADVLRADGEKVSRAEIGLPPRRCLVCGGPAAPCAAGRRHPAAEVFQKALDIIRAHFAAKFADDTASLAVRALLYELAVTPKPGLVDRANSGSHPDMDFFHFTASAAALFPYFRTCAALGMEHGATAECFARLTTEGALAEGAMLRATGGVNTHKGAIFTLGILCAAAGSLHGAGEPLTPGGLSAASARMTARALEEERAGA
ncbi:MAG TPA: citrate lyase holo-[acyl-carrier protein] synthase, partial [Candidatus Limnocylindria bacterium]|nr:citrate lyase holo-[acyl-carrier protein] synthase [Candidatus Limnocylindria bacterium]